MICSTTGTIVIPRETKFQKFPFKHSHFQVKTYVCSKTNYKPKSRFKDFNPLISTTTKTMAVEPFTSGASGRINALFSLRALRSLMMLVNAIVLLLLLPFRGQKRAVAINSGEKVGKDEKQESGRKGSAVVRVPAAMVPWRSGAVTVDQEAAARRALAIRRVVQDDDDDTVREFSLFVNARGETLFTQSWTPISVIVRGLVVLLHGLNEHSGRYNDFAKQLNANGLKVYGMDWIGHGGSDGLHAYVHCLDDAVTDMKMFLEKVLAENPGLPCFCFGHSTGAAIILKAVLDPKVEAQVAGIVLTSPAVGVQPSHPIFVVRISVLAPVISFLLPRYQVSIANKKGMPVSRDAEALVAKYSDPLVYTGSIRVRTGYEILRITSYLQQNMNRLSVPFLVLHGTDDTVTDPQASQKLYEEASSTDKTIKLFEGLLHDLLFEPERETIMNDIIQWLNCRV
ncbi:Serine aminopeptidase [Theobroma cacao]|nr:Serine aminopeptidase [Theobroma cacao]